MVPPTPEYPLLGFNTGRYPIPPSFHRMAQVYTDYANEHVGQHVERVVISSIYSRDVKGDYYRQYPEEKLFVILVGQQEHYRGGGTMRRGKGAAVKHGSGFKLAGKGLE